MTRHEGRGRTTVALVLCVSVALAACGERAPGAPSSVSESGSGDSSVRQSDDFGGRQLFPSDNWWNQEISGAPVDPQSNAYLDFIGRSRTANTATSAEP